jgi:hypothetical protein
MAKVAETCRQNGIEPVAPPLTDRPGSPEIV